MHPPLSLPVLSPFYRNLDGAPEALALSIAFAFRNGLEDAHADYGAAYGLGHDTIIPLNKRLARYCYERIVGRDLLSFLRSAEPEAWVDEMWRVGLVDSGALERITVPGQVMADARAKAVQGVVGAIGAWIAMLEEPSRAAVASVLNRLPVGWDDPSLPLAR